MSSITFQSITGEAQVGGRERAHAKCIIANMFEGMLNIGGLTRFNMTNKNKRAALARLAGLDINHDENFRDRMSLERIMFWLNPIFTESPRKLNDWEYVPWHVELNTALTYGSDVIAFITRLHAQCEIHGYVSEEDRPWLASLIEKGLEQGTLREETQGYGNGWRDVIALLLNGDGGPVVSQYSVCNGFHGSAGGGILRKNASEKTWEKWYDKEKSEWWPLAVEWLTDGADKGPRWSPDTLRLPFGAGDNSDTMRDHLEKAIEAETRPACKSCEGYGRTFAKGPGMMSIPCKECNCTGEAIAEQTTKEIAK